MSLLVIGDVVLVLVFTPTPPVTPAQAAATADIFVRFQMPEFAAAVVVAAAVGLFNSCTAIGI